MLHHAWRALDFHSERGFMEDVICQNAETPKMSPANDWILWISKLMADPKFAKVNEKVTVNTESFVSGSK